MDRAAGAEQRCRIVHASAVVHHLAPLSGAVPLARTRTRHDQVAVRLAKCVHIANAPGRSGRHSLLQQLHTLLPAPCADLCPSEQAERENLQVRGARLPRDRQRQSRVLGAFLHALRVPRPLHRNPAMPCAAPGAFKRALRARQPTARSRGASRDQVLVRDPGARPRRTARRARNPQRRARARRSRPPRSPGTRALDLGHRARQLFPPHRAQPRTLSEPRSTAASSASRPSRSCSPPHPGPITRSSQTQPGRPQRSTALWLEHTAGTPPRTSVRTRSPDRAPRSARACCFGNASRRRRV